MSRHLRTPENAPKARSGYCPYVVAMVVSIAVDGEGQRSGQGAGRPREAERAPIAIAEDRRDSALVERADQEVHLLAVKAGRENALLRERPRLVAQRLMVALVELETADAFVDERRGMVVGKDPPSF